MAGGHWAGGRYGVGRNASALRTGFTLIEIMVVVIVLAILAGAVMPNFRGTLNGLRLKTGAERVGEVMDYCYHAAIAEGRVHGLIFDKDGVHYHVLAEVRPPRAGEGGHGENDDDDATWNDVETDSDTGGDLRSEPRLEPVSLPLQETALPEGVRLVDINLFEEDLAKANGEELRILFFPDGTTEFATLTLQAIDGAKLNVKVNGVSGSVTILEPEPEKSDAGGS